LSCAICVFFQDTEDNPKANERNWLIPKFLKPNQLPLCVAFDYTSAKQFRWALAMNLLLQRYRNVSVSVHCQSPAEESFHCTNTSGTIIMFSIIALFRAEILTNITSVAVLEENVRYRDKCPCAIGC